MSNAQGDPSHIIDALGEYSMTRVPPIRKKIPLVRKAVPPLKFNINLPMIPAIRIRIPISRRIDLSTNLYLSAMLCRKRCLKDRVFRKSVFVTKTDRNELVDRSNITRHS